MAVESIPRALDQGRPRTRQPSELRVIKVVWQREVLTYTRDRPRMISGLFMPLVMMLILGEGLGNSIGELGGGINYRQFIFPGMVAQAVLMNSVFTGASIIWDKQFGFLREILVAPISRTSIVVGKLLGGTSIALLQGSIIFLAAPILGVELTPLIVLKMWALMAVLALAMTSLGIALASRLATQESFQMVTQLTIMPTMFLSGIMFPVNNIPAWLEVLAKLNPVTYLVAPLRSAALSNEIAANATGANLVTNVKVFGHVLTTAESLAIVAAFVVFILLFAVQSFRNQG
ncbi:MAG TPA: ABC transporter permease [Dehalococcoidia bacterium]|nr:ABC transporter permease [Dehalococcoidia bacterium]